MDYETLETHLHFKALMTIFNPDSALQILVLPKNEMLVKIHVKNHAHTILIYKPTIGPGANSTIPSALSFFSMTTIFTRTGPIPGGMSAIKPSTNV